MSSREIKFRAWDKELGMCDGDFLNEMVVNQDLIIDLIGGKLELTSHGDALIMMQYTGLKDKNGKEIYESDIIHYVIIDKDKIELIPCEIYFDMGAFYMKDTRMHGRSDLLSEAEQDDIEVVGNVFEDGDLLAKCSV